MNENRRLKILSIGIVRGLLGFIAGSLVGLALVTVIRLVLGLPALIPEAFGYSEPAWVTWALFGAIGFMIGTGVLSDWVKWARGQETPAHPVDAHPSGWA